MEEDTGNRERPGDLSWKEGDERGVSLIKKHMEEIQRKVDEVDKKWKKMKENLKKGRNNKNSSRNNREERGQGEKDEMVVIYNLTFFQHEDVLTFSLYPTILIQYPFSSDYCT